MGLIQKIFGTGRIGTKSGQVVEETANVPNLVRYSPEYFDEIVKPKVAGSNYITMFRTIPEVFWPIDYIASRVSGANFVLKCYKDDSVVWRNKEVNNILSAPNALMSWNELVYTHFVYKLATGNAFMRAAIAEVFADALKWKMCSNYWELPSPKVRVIPAGTNIPLYGIADKKDLIKSYRLDVNGQNIFIPPYEVWHDRDGMVVPNETDFMKAKSRLMALNKPISNLIAVYEARNVIYVKRGGLGFLVGQKKDVTGTVALTKEEKKALKQEHFDEYGVGKGQLPYGISDVPLTFVRTNLSISELQPFEETLMDAISIAGAYGIPAVLVPRKDQSTFSNQATAEKSVYTSVIMPMAKKFCLELTAFLDLDDSGFYLDCDFSDVDCLQQGLRESEEVKKLANERCSLLFDKGLISLNDWRSQNHESKVEIPLFDKLKFEMTDSELAEVNKIFNNTMTGGNENEGSNQKPAVQDEGE